MKVFDIPRRKIILLGSLYFAQGLPFGFFYQALPVLMRERDFSLVAIGVSSLLAAPWGLKFLWAPFIDRYGHRGFGRRRSFIIPIQMLSALILLGIAGYGTERDFAAVLSFVFVVNLLAATQDIAADGLALDVLASHERGAANGIQVAGFRIGMIIGGGVLLMLVGAWGWSLTFATMSVLMLASSLPILRHQEPPPPPSDDASPSVAAIASALVRRPGSFEWLGLVFAYKLGHHLAQSMLRPYLVDIGADKAEIGFTLGVVGSTAGLAGAIIGGAWVCSLGERRAMVTFAIGQAVAVAGYAVAVIFDAGLVGITAVSIVEHAVSGMATVALFTAMMNASQPASAATDYTIQACLVVIATAIANVVGGVSATYFGYAGHFTAATVVCALIAAWAAYAPTIRTA